ncbi:type VI secretion system-associated protein TagF [Parachitinimonas caeni]|uniref:Type VI secretion system-associated protein TagF n=1 Tax=Parachitinimonas caeni TaxID=3031301 RepID=A0ABT7E2L2_9NEIS|nr:type VI secretion system-associated protein TagF [Parachitinimonas caeni]MDK2126556.1 type VI secretion system-associated protein TagF [Parachitinimonas caeni]
MSGNDLPVAGWYGKIPALADFASRRLDPAFVTAWDGWLRASLLVSKEKLGQAWLDRYLTARVWRFLLTPGVCGNAAYIGVMMPSVDGVGRYYPFTICAPISPPWTARFARAEGMGWFSQVERVALEALSQNLSPDHIDEALLRCGLPRALPEDAQLDDTVSQLADAWRLRPNAITQMGLKGAHSLGDLFLSMGRTTFGRMSEGKSLWWTDAPEFAMPILLRFDGMPPPHAFAQFLLLRPGEPEASQSVMAGY